MARATWNEEILAESDSVEIVEGNIYFPAASIKRELFEDSQNETEGQWKGTAHYYHIKANGAAGFDAISRTRVPASHSAAPVSIPSMS